MKFFNILMAVVNFLRQYFPDLIQRFLAAWKLDTATPEERPAMIRFRNKFIVVGGLLVVMLWLLTDPALGLITALPFGAGTLAETTMLLRFVVLVGFLHAGRRALIDYIDLEVYFRKAIETPQGAGLALVAVGGIFLSLAIVLAAVLIAQ